MGTRVYLSCTTNEELVDGHCLIVPIQHHLVMLEGDDDVWDEARVRLWPKSPESELTNFLSLSEFHEKSHADVQRTGQGCYLLRNCGFVQATSTHVYRVRASTVGTMGRDTWIL